jgi:hypothetical protein
MNAKSSVEDVRATLHEIVAPDVVCASTLDVCAARVAESVIGKSAAFVLHPKVNALLAQTVACLLGEAQADLQSLIASIAN